MNGKVYCLEVNKLNSWEKTYFSLSKNQSENFTHKDGIFENFEYCKVNDDIVKSKSCFSISPDYYWNGKCWQLFENEPLNQISMQIDNLISVKKKHSNTHNLKLNFNVSWVEEIFVKKSVDFELESVDLDKLSTKLESLKHSSHFYLNLYFKNIVHSYSIQNFLLKKNYHINLKGEVIFFHESFNKQNVCICFQGDKTKKVKEQNLFLVIPKKNTFNVWKKDLTYYSNDIVFYDDNLYMLNNVKFLKEEISPDKSRNWKLFESIGASFFDSNYGSKLFSDLKQRLNFYLEKKIGNKIILTFLQKDDISAFQLNNSFIYEGCNYRIISFMKKYMDKKILVEMTGLEILPFDSWNLDSFREIEDTNLTYKISLETENNKRFLCLGYPIDSIFSQSKEITVNLKENRKCIV